MVLSGLKSLSDQIDIALRGFYTGGRLFLKTMQDVNCIAKTDRVNGAVGIRIKVLNQLEDTRASKPLQRFCIWMSETALGQIQCVTKNILYISGHLLEIFLATANPQEWLPCTHAKNIPILG
ncbi:hypothetical protein EMIT0P2_20366 [Pseudomonas sp. IT-P2]